eukprot:1160691-Amphidinium_carterae.3
MPPVVPGSSGESLGTACAGRQETQSKHLAVAQNSVVPSRGDDPLRAESSISVVHTCIIPAVGPFTDPSLLASFAVVARSVDDDAADNFAMMTFPGADDDDFPDAMYCKVRSRVFHFCTRQPIESDHWNQRESPILGIFWSHTCRTARNMAASRSPALKPSMPNCRSARAR